MDPNCTITLSIYGSCTTNRTAALIAHHLVLILILILIVLGRDTVLLHYTISYHNVCSNLGESSHYEPPEM